MKFFKRTLPMLAFGASTRTVLGLLPQASRVLSCCQSVFAQRTIHGGDSRCFSSVRSNENAATSLRQDLLAHQLVKLDIDAVQLDKAAISSIEDPLSGYDGRYGKSAIRTYRSFVFPKHEENNTNSTQLTAAAGRCARQIQFLLNRHKAHQAEFVRHHDATNTTRDTKPLIILLDQVRSAFNVGSVFRTADAAGCVMVVTTGITPHPAGGGAEKLQKSALGAELCVPNRHFVSTGQAVDFLRESFPDYKIIGMETTEHSLDYTEYNYPVTGVALVLGNEVTGVDTDILQQMDAIVEIPMFGAKNSLNIAACAPVVLYEIIRQWNQ